MIYAVVGPTCVGKTSFSVYLAKKVNAEIINCDSMQVYKELNIGVAKVREGEKEGIKHHLFDAVSVTDDFSAYDFQTLGRIKIKEILARGKNVVVVGGTGLYLKALLYDYTFDGKVNKNKKLYDFLLIGLTKDRKSLYCDINKRVDAMFNEGLVKEVKDLYDNGINTRAIKTAIGYKELYEYFDGKLSIDEARELIKRNSRRYAKRQYTFFYNQFDTILWFDVENVSKDEMISDILNKCIL